ncbi:MAG: hypothetical protein J6T01_01520, partial [Kiritimatiellae bacterium]|nr:hypothetical protein [Kiritimatiellia bacterium]
SNGCNTVVGGELNRNTMAFYGSYHSFRLYNRALTADEVAWNAALDRVRFEEADLSELDAPGAAAGYRYNAATGKIEVFVKLQSTSGTISVDGGDAAESYAGWVEFGSSLEIALNIPAGWSLMEWYGAGDIEAGATPGTYTLSATFAANLTAVVGTGYREWTGGGDGADWFDAGNWDPLGAPAVGNYVTIPANSVVIITNSTAALESLSVAGTLLCSNWTTRIAAESVSVASTGKITTGDPPGNGEMSNRVWIATASFTLAAGGTINVDGQGYKGVSSAFAGNGPGGAKKVGLFCGAAHGGHGGKINAMNALSDNTLRHSRQPMPYGDVHAPELTGSGGVGKNTTNYGGHGGGAVKIDAAGGEVTINGTISANGTKSATNGGGGSGGSVYVICRTITGSGSLSANGGDLNGESGAGGGGRIAVVYDKVEQAKLDKPSLKFSAGAGSYGTSARTFDTVCRRGEIGTVYFPDQALLTEPINATGQLYFDEPSWHTASLTIEGRWVAFPQEGFDLDVSGDVTIKTRSNVPGRLDVGGSELLQYSCMPMQVYNGFRRFPVSQVTRFHVGGDLKIGAGTAYCDLVFPAARLTAADAESETPLGGTIRVDGTVTISKGSSYSPVSHLITGVSPMLHCRNFNLESGASVYANNLGYLGGCYTNGNNGAFALENQKLKGFGPGAWQVSTAAASGCGAAHGGLAEGMTDVSYLYDSERNPHMPGSGCSGGTSGYDYTGTSGGGMVYVKADGKAVIAGSVTANGSSVGGNHMGGSSGGSICIVAKRLRVDSTASLKANGGGKSSLGKAGGGGRIALHRMYDMSGSVVTNLESLAARATAAGGNSAAGAGTVYLGRVPGSGLLIWVR